MEHHVRMTNGDEWIIDEREYQRLKDFIFDSYTVNFFEVWADNHSGGILINVNNICSIDR